MEYLDLALDYLKDHKFIAALIAILFLILLIRNFWFLIKLLVVLALGVVVVFLIYNFIGETTKKKKDLLKPGESSHMAPVRPYTAECLHHTKFSDLFSPMDDPLSRLGSIAVARAFQEPDPEEDK